MIKLFTLLFFVSSALALNGKFQSNVINKVGVVGGDDASIENHPYALSLMRNSIFTCGATLISSEWVITSARCTYGADPNDIQIRGGSRILFMGEECRVWNYLEHPKFTIATNDYDVSLVQLRDPFTIDNVAPIPLVDDGFLPQTGDSVELVGFGLLSEDGPTAYVYAANLLWHLGRALSCTLATVVLVTSYTAMSQENIL